MRWAAALACVLTPAWAAAQGVPLPSFDATSRLLSVPSVLVDGVALAVQLRLEADNRLSVASAAAATGMAPASQPTFSVATGRLALPALRVQGVAYRAVFALDADQRFRLVAASPVTAGADATEPVAGNVLGACAVPATAQPADVSRPQTIIGNGSPQSCTGDAVVQAVARGGVITFACGDAPVTITLPQTAKVFNNRPDVVLDGGGKVTLSGAGQRRILYQNTCDQAQVWTTPTCQNQASPTLTLQNITLRDGNATGETMEGGGGGAVFVRGGRLKIINSRFFGNQCDPTGPDMGGGAVRALSIFNGEPVQVASSTFGGAAGLGNACSNGGALSSIGVSWAVTNSVFTHNRAIGNGANPAKPGTPGGGSGGAIYNDGNAMHLQMCGSVLRDNQANEGGGAVFYVSNDRSGRLTLTDSLFERNPSAGFESAGFPGFFIIAAPGQPVVSGSVLAR